MKTRLLLFALVLVTFTSYTSAVETTVALDSGWNMISSDMQGVGKQEIKQQCSWKGGPWWWDKQSSDWNHHQEMKSNKGYWVQVSESCEVTFDAPPAPPETIELEAGWNLVSSTTGDVGKEEIVENCEWKGGPWWWSNEKSDWVFEQDMQPFRGYWVQVESSCEINPSGDDSSGSDNSDGDTGSDDSSDEGSEDSGDSDYSGPRFEWKVSDAPSTEEPVEYDKSYNFGYKLVDHGYQKNGKEAVIPGTSVKIQGKNDIDASWVSWTTLEEKTCKGETEKSKGFCFVNVKKNLDSDADYLIRAKTTINGEVVKKTWSYTQTENFAYGWDPVKKPIEPNKDGESKIKTMDYQGLPKQIDTGEYGYCGSAFFKKKFKDSFTMNFDLSVETDANGGRIVMTKDTGPNEVVEEINPSGEAIEKDVTWKVEVDSGDILRIGIDDQNKDWCNYDDHSLRLEIKDIYSE